MIKNSFAALALALPLAGCEPEEPHPGAYQGVLEFDERELAFEIGGRIRELSAERGGRVEKGTVIARLDDSLEQATITVRDREVAAARAQAEVVAAGSRPEEVRAARAQVRAVQASESLLEKNLERERTLLAKGAVAPVRVDELEARLASTTAEREAAEQRLRALERGARKQEIASAAARTETASAALELERERAGRHELVSPFSGVVTDIHIESGEIAAAGAPVLTVADTLHPYADVFVPQSEAAGIRAGNAVRAFVDASGAEVAGKVERVWERTEFTPRFLFSARERENLVLRVRVRLDDPSDRLPAGVPLFAYIEGKKAR